MSRPTHGSQRLKSKTGCLTCRARRKKCDEEHPTCVGCRRNHLICTWPLSVTQHTRSATTPDHVDPRDHPPGWSEGEGGSGSDSGGGNGSGSSTAIQRFVTADKKQVRHLLPLLNTVDIHPALSSSLPGLRKESAKHIFDHYLRVTATEITGRSLPLSPFVSYLLPVAYQDTRVVACLLALSGAHLCSYKDGRFEHDARSYYAVTLRSVKHWLLDWKDSSTQNLISLFVVMLTLCWFENLTSEMNGNVYLHLRASRTVLLELRSRHQSPVRNPLLDLLTEVYAFLAISANITIGTDFPISRHIPYDDFLSPEALLSLNQGSDIHGILMGSSHELLGLIIPIAESARHHMRTHDAVQKAKAKQNFERRIRAWKHVPLLSTTDDATERAAGEIHQQTLLVFLHTMFHGTERPSLALMETVDGILDKIWESALRLPPESRIHTTMTWAARIVGSVCRTQKHRAMMSRQMNVLPENKPRAKDTEFFLEDLWVEMDKDDTIYGPHGIEILMRRRNMSLGCA